MTEKRFTTVELPKPNRWGIWYDGAYLSTYQVCILLNEYVDVKKENEQLKQRNDRQYNQLKQLWELIEDEDYNTLRSMLNQRETDEKLLQKEWETYSD